MKYEVTFMAEAYPNDNLLNNYLSQPDEITEVFNKYSAEEDKEYIKTNIHRIEWEAVVVIEAENREILDKKVEEIREKLEEGKEMQVETFHIQEF